MRQLFIIASFCLFVTSTVWAHGGRTDACGGHNDRKHGGYHVHNYSKYCACNPDAPECKKEKDNAEKKDIKKRKKK